MSGDELSPADALRTMVVAYADVLDGALEPTGPREGFDSGDPQTGTIDVAVPDVRDAHAEGDAHAAFVHAVDQHRVHAKRRQGLPHPGQVGRGHANRSAPVVAVHDLATERMGTAEHPVNRRQIPGGQRGAHAGARVRPLRVAAQ